MTDDATRIADALAAARAGSPLRSKTGRLQKLPKSATPADRLASGSVTTQDGCREWRGARDRDRYGSISIGGKRRSVHRLAFQIAFGPVPAGHDVCHRCDNPICIAPEHLFAGTRSDNMADMVAKGRQTLGEKNGQAKLTEADVLAIRRLISSGDKQSAIAARFGVNPTVVSRIKLGVRWAHTGGQLCAAHEPRAARVMAVLPPPPLPGPTPRQLFQPVAAQAARLRGRE